MRNTGTPEERAEHQKDFRRSQSAMFSLESDKSRLTRKKNDLVDEVHHLKGEHARLAMSLKEKDAALRSIEREIELVDEELARAKKHMDAL